MGGSSPTGSSSTSAPTVPAYLYPILQNGVNQYTSAAGQLPGIPSLYQNAPLQGTPQLTAQQNQNINSIQQLGQSGGTYPGEQQAMTNLGQIANPQASQQAFQQFAAPEVMQQAALAGQGQSGAADYSLSQAAIPYELQAQQTQMQAANSQAQLGQQQVTNQGNQLAQALQASGIPYDVAQQMAQNQYNQQQQQWGLAKDIQTFPFQLFGQTIGGGTQVSSAPKF